MKLMRRAWLAGFVLCLPLSARATVQGAPDLRVQHAWSRPAMAGHTGVVYLSITAHGTADRLVGVSSPDAERAELHRTVNDHGIMKMRAVASLLVPAGRTVTLKPGGYHIMLIGLKHRLSAGDSVKVTLHFAKAGNVAAVAMVETGSAAAQQPQARGEMRSPQNR